MEWIAFGLDTIAVVIILLTIPLAVVRSGLVRGIVKATAREPGEVFKHKLVGGILLGVDFLVASDVIMTAALEATPRNMLTLLLLVVIRILLAWSLTVEVEGHWPWQSAAARGGTPGGTGQSRSD